MRDHTRRTQPASQHPLLPQHSHKHLLPSSQPHELLNLHRPATIASLMPMLCDKHKPIKVAKPIINQSFNLAFCVTPADDEPLYSTDADADEDPSD